MIGVPEYQRRKAVLAGAGVSINNKLRFMEHDLVYSHTRYDLCCANLTTETAAYMYMLPGPP